MRKMKCLLIVLCALSVVPLAANAPAHGESSHGESGSVSPLTPGEQALVFAPRFRVTDDHGAGSLVVDGEPLSVDRIFQLSPWDLMELVQRLSGAEVPLGRFGSGGDELTQAWRQKVAAFATGPAVHHSVHEEDLFDPALVLWDPGFIQHKNSWGQWSIRIDNRDIVQGDIPTLSPLEVQQAVAVLTGRTYTAEFVLDHLEAFRAQLSIVPRAAAPATGGHP